MRILTDMSSQTKVKTEIRMYYFDTINEVQYYPFNPKDRIVCASSLVAIFSIKWK